MHSKAGTILRRLLLAGCAVGIAPTAQADEPSAPIEIAFAARTADDAAGQTAVEPATDVSNRKTVAQMAGLSHSNPFPEGALALTAQPPASGTGQGVARLVQEAVPAADPPADPAGERPRALTPLEVRELSVDVRLVDLTMADIGTGELPEPTRRYDAPPMLLPDGFARGATYKNYCWYPGAICHFPLYFEEPMLERHGHVRFPCVQSLVSGAKFIGTIPLLPYLYTLQRPCEPVYSLGQWRPGSCAPLLRQQIPYDRDAMIVESVSAAAYFWAAPL